MQTVQTNINERAVSQVKWRTIQTKPQTATSRNQQTTNNGDDRVTTNSHAHIHVNCSMIFGISIDDNNNNNDCPSHRLKSESTLMCRHDYGGAHSPEVDALRKSTAWFAVRCVDDARRIFSVKQTHNIPRKKAVLSTITWTKTALLLSHRVVSSHIDRQFFAPLHRDAFEHRPSAMDWKWFSLIVCCDWMCRNRKKRLRFVVEAANCDCTSLLPALIFG